MKIFFISLAAVVLIGLSIGIGYFLYQKNYSSEKTVGETNWGILNYRIPFQSAAVATSSNSLPLKLPISTPVKSPAINQDYLTFYQGSINNLNKISAAVIDIQKTLIKIQQEYESEDEDYGVLLSLISEGIAKNTILSSSISDFRNSLDNWSAANTKTTEASIKSKTEQTVEAGKNFSQAASEFSDILGKILNSKEEDEIIQLSQQLQTAVQKMNDDGNQLNKLFTELNNFLTNL